MFQLRSNYPFRSAAAALAVGAGLAMPVVASAETVVLSYSPWLPPGYVVNEAIFPWMEKVEEATEGRVIIEPRAAGVGTPQEQFDVVRDGLADISLVVPSFTPGRFPLLELGELPLLSSDAAILAPAFYRIYKEHLAQFEPFSGTQMLSLWNVAPAQLTTRAGIIDEFSDFDGLKVRVANAAISRGMEALGAVPVQTSIADAYMMASTGAVDGMTMPYEPTVTWNLYPFFRYITAVPGGLGQSGMALLVNERKWNSISEEDREAIMEISGEPLATAVGQAVAKDERAAAAKLREEGVTIKRMPSTVLAKLTEQFKVVNKAWFAKAEKAGLSDPAEVLADFLAELKTAEKENK